MKPTLEERLFSRLIIDPSGCLLWTGYIGQNGYGQIYANGRLTTVHRVMHELFIGPIPEGLHIDHLCRVKHCGAPAHLEAVTCKENLHRAPHPNAIKTECINGHDYTLANTYFGPRGNRHCRKCDAIHSAEYRARKLAAAQ